MSPKGSVGAPVTQTRILSPDENGLAAAAAILRRGGLVAIPTETVYGLAADAADDAAVAAIFAAKDRPTFNPLIAHVLGVDDASREARFSAAALKLAETFWPGPLTLVLPAKPEATVSLLARAGLDSVALRAPSHRVARRLIAAVGRPLAAPSANRSGRVSATDAQHVLEDLNGRIDALIDGGPSPVGVESTIVSFLDSEPIVLRNGAVPSEDIEAALGVRLALAAAPALGGVRAPGGLASHYAPRARLRLNARIVESDEALLNFAGLVDAGAARAARDLSPSGDLREAAANLFRHLRALDATGVETIAAAPIPSTGLGAAINDRLLRAAAPRSQPA